MASNISESVEEDDMSVVMGFSSFGDTKKSVSKPAKPVDVVDSKQEPRNKQSANSDVDTSNGDTLQNTREDVQESDEDEVDGTTIDTTHKKKEKSMDIESFEEQIIAAEDDLEAKAESYKKYIFSEKKQKRDPTQIQSLYERSVADCPLNPSLWLDYIHFVVDNLPTAELTLSVTERATTNCPWLLDAWSAYLIATERYDEDNLLGIFEKAIVNCATSDQIGTLWIKYLECLRRILRKKDFSEKDMHIFISSCEAAEKHILSGVDSPSEPNEYVFVVAMMNVRLLASKPDRLRLARDMWEDLLVRGYGSSFHHWLPYLVLEHRYGDDNSYRQQLSKATACIKDDLRSIADLWLSFERDNGEVNHLKSCEKKIRRFMQELEASRPRSFASRKRFGKPSRGGFRGKRSRGPPREQNEASTSGAPEHDFKTPRVPARMLQRRAPTAFVPRSLQVHQNTGSTEPTSSPAPPQEPTVKMTNQDFRAKFLGPSS